MLWVLIGGAILTGLLCLGVFWDRVVDHVTNWLHERDLDKTILMDAWVRIDRLVFGIRARVKVYIKKKNRKRSIKVSEEEVDISDIDDPNLIEKIREQKRVKENIMEMVA